MKDQFKRYKLLNLYIDVISYGDLVSQLLESVRSRNQKCLVFINTLKYYQASKDNALKAAIEGADYILPDGISVLVAGKIFGVPVKERINGTDLFETLLKMSDKYRFRVFFLGATKDNLSKLLITVSDKYPNIIIGGTRNGYFSDQDNADIVEEINASNSDILFLGISSPKKEIWVNEVRQDLRISIIQGVGGSFDVVAGIIPRAPKWMQKYGLEWLHRVLKEPQRMFKRYLIANSYFVFLILSHLHKKYVLRKQ
jgi:N-acetylglucosaminyldiphosphoundecaprenol N-acetyl-beta-D-mannosaminyltransferase